VWENKVMKVFFSAARSARSEYGGVYQKIVETLQKKSFQVYDDTKAFLDVDVLALTDKDKKQVYHKMIAEMDKADLSVFEASWPSSIHTGHKITLSYWKNKPVIALYREGKGYEPILFRGIESKKVLWVSYTEDNLEKKLLAALEEARKMLDIRFNLFIPRELMAYLDWVAKDVGINRSEYIRRLIEKEAKKRK